MITKVFLDQTMRAFERVIEAAHHHPVVDGGDDGVTQWRWSPQALPEFDEVEAPTDISSMDGLSADDIEDLTALSEAVSDAQALSAKFHAAPWPFRTDKQLEDEPATEDEFATDDVLNRIFILANKCGRLR